MVTHPQRWLTAARMSLGLWGVEGLSVCRAVCHTACLLYLISPETSYRGWVTQWRAAQDPGGKPKRLMCLPRDTLAAESNFGGWVTSKGAAEGQERGQRGCRKPDYIVSIRYDPISVYLFKFIWPILIHRCTIGPWIWSQTVKKPWFISAWLFSSFSSSTYYPSTTQ